MKVALVLTGLLRCFEQAYPKFKEYVLDKYDTDVYIDIWSEVGFYSGKGYLPQVDGFVRTVEGERGFHDSGEVVDAKRIIELYKPWMLRIEDFNKFEPIAEKRSKNFPNALTRPKNTICQAYKIARGMELVVNSGLHYDLIIRARPDLVLENPLPEVSPDQFYVMPWRNSRGEGVGDGIQIGNFENMAAFANMFNYLEAIYEIAGYSCSHKFVEIFLDKNAIPTTFLYMGAHVAHSPRGMYQEPE